MQYLIKGSNKKEKKKIPVCVYCEIVTLPKSLCKLFWEFEALAAAF